MSCKLLSVDVWDTLLRREVHPDGVKLATSRYIFQALSSQTKQLFRTQQEILQLRQAIERKIIMQRLDGHLHGEYALPEVLNEMADILCPNPNERSDFASAALKYEIAFEKEVSYKDPQIEKTLASFDADQIIFLSDFYLSASYIKEFLEHAQIPAIYTQGLSSCDLGLNKRSGSIFLHIHDKYQITPSEHMHVGDNVIGDVKVPRSLGMQVYHYQPRTLHRKRKTVERSFTKPRAYISTQLNQYIEDNKYKFPHMNKLSQHAYNLGLSYSPLFIGFAQNIREQVEKNNIHKIYFISREGKFLKSLYDGYVAHISSHASALNLPATYHLELSRASTYAASLDDLSIASMMTIWRQIKTMSITNLLITMNCNTKEIRQYLHAQGIDIDKPRKRLWLNRHTIAIMQDKQFIYLCEQNIKQQRINLLNYLSRKDLTPEMSGNILFVDIGWRGSIQDNLARLLPNINSFGAYLGIIKYINTQASHVEKAAYLFDLNKQIMSQNTLRDSNSFELICNCRTGSVVGYERHAPYRPITVEVTEEQQLYDDFCRHFQSAIINMTNYFGRDAYTHSIVSNDLYQASFKIYNKIGNNTHWLLKYVLHRNIRFNNLFGYGRIEKKLRPLDKLIIRRSEKIVKFFKKTIKKARKTRA